MPKTQGYDRFSEKYDQWYDDHPSLYQSELALLQHLLPSGEGIEIGAGTARFAAPLHIATAIEPSAAMRALAAKRGIQALDGVAEALPVAEASHDFALFVTAICFVDSVEKALSEAFRVVKPNGWVLVAFIDKHSELGQQYQQLKADNPFYAQAQFVSVDDITTQLKHAGFAAPECYQTLCPQDMDQTDTLPFKPGFGDGAFVVAKAQKPA
ncbi:MAG: class I SAM-dependent methyltransferase [Hydrogenovibrio sp.]